PFGAFLRMGGTFGVRRNEPDREALRTVHDTLQLGGTVGVFIQGHRQEGLDEAKAGAGRIAVVEDADIVPVALHSRGWRPGRHIRVAFGEPRRYGRDGRRAADAYRETADQLMEEIRRLYGAGGCRTLGGPGARPSPSRVGWPAAWPSSDSPTPASPPSSTASRPAARRSCTRPPASPATAPRPSASGAAASSS